MRSHAIRRAALPLRLLLPGRRLAARRAGGRRPGARAHHAGPHRPRLGLGLDGVRAGRARPGWPAPHPRRRGDGDRRDVRRPAPPHAARARRPRVGQPLPAAHPRPCPHAGVPLRTPRAAARRPPARARLGDADLARGGRAAHHPRGRRGPRRGPGLPQRLRAPGSPRRADHAPAAARVRARRLPRRAAAALPPPRPRAQPRPGRARRSPRRSVRGHGQRPCAHARAREAAGRLRGHPRAHHARRLRTPAPRQPQPRPRHTGGHGRALRRPPPGGRRDAAPGRHPALRPHQRPGLSLPRRRGRRSRSQAGRGLPRVLRGPLPDGLEAAVAGRRAPGGGAEPHRRARAVGLLPAAPRDARARPRGGRRGARALHGARAAAARARARVVGVLDRLLPHRPLARRPDRQQAAARALPQRGDLDAARHRPRLPARRARGPHPARARPLRARPRRARGRLPDLPCARRHPRAGQGAGPAPGRDRARGARLGGLERGGRRSRHRDRSGADRVRRPPSPHAPAGNGWARCQRRPTACPVTSPSTPAA